MKIAMVSPYDWCVPGGVNRHVLRLSEHFRGWGHDVTIFAPASHPSMVNGECVPVGRPRSVRASGSVARITFSRKAALVREQLEQGQFDIVHAHEPLMPLLPYYFLRHSTAANVGTFHAAKEGGNRVYEYTRSYTRRYFRKLDGKIAVSPAAVNLVSRYFDGYFNIIPNGIDFEHFAAPREPLPEFMDGKLNILFVGRPEKRKGLKYLLRAFVRIHEVMPDTRLIVVGAGDFSRYERTTQGIGDIVFRSHVPYDELPRYHHTAHVFCAPNTGNESQGYSIMEALAAGMAVVASNIEGFAGVITSELDGVLVRPRNEDAIAEAIIRVLRDESLRHRLAIAGQARADQYRWDTVAHKVMSYYERLLYERQQVAEARARAEARHS